MNPSIFDSRTPRGSSSIPTLVIPRMECCKTEGDSSWTSSTSGTIARSSCPIGNAEVCVAALPSIIKPFKWI